MKTFVLATVAIAATVAGCDAGPITEPSRAGPTMAAAVAKLPSAWATFAPMPVGVQAPVAATDGRFVYVFGGATEPTTWTTLTQIYDVKANAWTLGPAFTTPRNFAMAVAMQDGIHLLGGANPGRLADHQVYDPKSRSWSNRSPMPVAVDAAVIAVVGKKLYLIGGAQAGPVAAVQIWDSRTNTWAFGAPMPTPRLSAVGAVIGRSVYVAAGQVAGVREVGTLERYDVDTDSWATLTSMPVARDAAAGGLVGHSFCVFGGRVANPSPTGHALPDTYCYDVRSDTWSQGPPMLTPRVEMATAEVPGRLYAFGGRSETVFANGTVETLERR